FLLPRRSDLTREQFFDFSRKKHLPLVMALPGLRRCVISEVVAAPEGDLPCDAMVECWWDDLPAVREMTRCQVARACEASLAQFVDLPKWSVFLTREGE